VRNGISITEIIDIRKWRWKINVRMLEVR